MTAVVEAWLSASRVGALARLRVQGQGVALSGTASLLKVDASSWKMAASAEPNSTAAEKAR